MPSALLRIFWSGFACCTFTRESFLVEKLVRLAFQPGSLSRKICQFFLRTHEQIKLVNENLLVCAGLKIYKIVKQREKRKKDIVQMTVVKDKDGRMDGVLIGEKEVKDRWKE